MPLEADSLFPICQSLIRIPAGPLFCLTEWLFPVTFADSSFHQAVGAGDAHAVNAMLADGADVNAQNENGHTPIIHAIVAGQYHLLPVLLNAGAHPALRDKTGLSAIDWAERKGRPDLAQWLTSPPTKSTPVAPQEPRNEYRAGDEAQRQPISPDEKSRKFIAGLRQRLEEKANRELADDQREASNTEEIRHEPRRSVRQSTTRKDTLVEPKREATPTAAQIPENPVKPKREAVRVAPKIPKDPIVSESDPRPLRSSPVSSPPVFEPHASSHRKRCPQCGTTYNSELLAYCVYHEVALVGADEPITIAPAESRMSLLWVLVLIAMVLGAVGGLVVTRDLFKTATVNSPAPAASSPVTQKGIPTLGKQLAGKEVLLQEAEVPANTVTEPTTITVHISIGRDGRVSPTSANGGDQVLRDAVVEAARKSTFSAKKLGGRGAEGNISYTFK